MANRHSKKKKIALDHHEDLEVNEGDEKGIQTIHEMIAEALTGVNSSNSSNAVNGSSDYFSKNGPNNFQLDPKTGLPIDVNSDDQEPITLEKIFCKFRNLDCRLSRIEDIILKREVLSMNAETVEKRVPTLLRSEYPYFGNEPSSPTRLGEISSIDPILTSSTDILSAYSNFPSSSAYSLQLSELVSKMKRVDDIRVISELCFC